MTRVTCAGPSNARGVLQGPPANPPSSAGQLYLEPFPDEMVVARLCTAATGVAAPRRTWSRARVHGPLRPAGRSLFPTRGRRMFQDDPPEVEALEQRLVEVLNRESPRSMDVVHACVNVLCIAIATV